MTIQFFELASSEHVRSLESGTRVVFGVASPGSWITANPNVTPILEEIERLAPLGIERIQLGDGICCYEAEIFNGTNEELMARRAERTSEHIRRMEEMVKQWRIWKKQGASK